MADKKTTDIFGNEITIGPDGSRIKHSKNIWGEDVAYDSNGNKYTSHTGFFGEKITHSSDGVTYRSHENIWGDTVTYGDDGSEYVTGKTFFGDTKTYQTKDPDPKPDSSNSVSNVGISSQQLANSWGNTTNNESGFVDPLANTANTEFKFADPFEGLSDAQIQEIYKKKLEEQEERDRHSIKKTPVFYYYHISLIMAVICIIPTFITYDQTISIVNKLGRITIFLPLIAYLTTVIITASDKTDSFPSILLGVWINHVILNIALVFYAISAMIDWSLQSPGSGNGWLILLALVNTIVFFLSINSIVNYNTDNKLSSVIYGKGKTGIIIFISICVNVFGWVVSILSKLETGKSLRLPYIISVTVLFLLSLYCYSCYIKDKNAAEAKIRSQIESTRKSQEEKNTSPKYNSSVKIEDAEDDVSIPDSYPMQKIKERAAYVATNIDKPFDVITVDILRAGVPTKEDFKFNGWILQKCINRNDIYINSPYEPLTEIYGDEYYYVLEATGELKVYHFHYDLDNLAHNYGMDKGSFIKRHNINFKLGNSFLELSKIYSLRALDYSSSVEHRVAYVDDEMRVFFESSDEGMVYSSGEGIKIRLDKLLRQNLKATGTTGDELTIEKACAELGLDRVPATRDELSKTYQILAKKYHKDYGDEPNQDKYEAVRNAYDYLIGKLF